MTLVPCAACARHVKADESRCPFCDAALTAPTARAMTALPRSRAALMFGAVFGAASLAGAIGVGCNASPPAPAYGGPPPPPDMHSLTVTPVTAGDAGPAPFAVSAYGAPAPTDTAPHPADAGTKPSSR